MDDTAINDVVQRYYPFLISWILFAARFLGTTLLFPLFSWLNLTPLVRFSFAAAMSAPLAYMELIPVSAVKALSAPDLFVLTTKEMFIGALIGLVAGIPFWAAQNCGELIDTYRGSSAGALFDPSLTTETSELGSGLILLAIALFVWSGGLIPFTSAIYQTYLIWPPQDMLPTLKLASALPAANAIATQLAIALSMAGAVLLCLFAVDFAMAIFGRSTRQIQIFDISQVVKNLALAVLLPLIGAALTALIAREIARGSFNVDMLRLLLP